MLTARALSCPVHVLPVAGCDTNWTWLSPNPSGGMFDKILLTSRRIIALRAGHCLRSSDFGMLWEDSETRYSTGLLMMCPFDSHTCLVDDSILVTMAVCNGSKILKSEDGGVTWIATGGLPAGLHVDDIGARTSTFAWCTTDWKTGLAGHGMAALLVSHDAGASWDTLRSDTANAGTTYLNTFFLDSLHFWMEVWNNDVRDSTRHYVIRTTNGGATWSKREFSHKEPNESPWYPQFYDSVRGIGESEYWHNYVFSDDGGTSWQPFAGPRYGNEGNTGVSHFSVDTGGVVSVIIYEDVYNHPDSASALPFIFASTSDHGRTWVRDTSYPLDYSQIGEISNIQLYGSQAAVINTVGTGAFVFTTDHGKTWNSRNAFQSGILNGLFFVDDQQGLALVSSRWPNQRNGAYRTSDAGIHWNQLTEVKGTPYSYSMPEGKHIYLSDDDGSVFKSVDSGKTFQSLSTVPKHNFPFHSIQFVDSMCGWLFSQSNGIWKSVDGGETWVQQREEVPIHDSQKRGIFSCASMIDRDYGWAIEDILLRTTNGGDTWDTLGTGYLYTFGCQFITRMHGYLFSYGPTTETTDGGFTWHATNIGGPALHFIDSTFGWSGSRITTDGGRNWLDRSCLQINPRIAWWANTTQGWTTDINSDNFLFHYGNLAGTSAVAYATSQPRQRLLHILNYPNPFSHSTAIAISDASAPLVQAEHSWLRIYDGMGSVVADLSQSLQSQNTIVNFDASRLPAGVYYCKGQVGMQSIAQPIIVVR